MGRYSILSALCEEEQDLLLKRYSYKTFPIKRMFSFFC